MKIQINLNEEISRINDIMKNVRMISEGLYLEDEYGDPDDSDAFEANPEEMPEDMPAEQPAAPEEGNEDPTSSLGGDFVNKIRAITLDGMKQLNNTPEDPRFQALLKIFNICNKAVDDQKEQPERPNVQ